jgi:hypothetical protein
LPRLSRIKASTLPQQKIFQDVLSFTGRERCVAKAASYFVIDGLRPRLGFDDLVECPAAWTLEERKRAWIRHDCPPTEALPRSDVRWICQKMSLDIGSTPRLRSAAPGGGVRKCAAEPLVS